MESLTMFSNGGESKMEKMLTAIDQPADARFGGRLRLAHLWWKLKPVALLILGFALMHAFLPNCKADTPLLSPEAKRALRLQPGVVLVYVTYKVEAFNDSFPCGVSGSGFLYRPDGYLITNGHVVQFANVKDLQAQKAFVREVGRCIFDHFERKGHPEAEIQAALKAHPEKVVWSNPDIDVVFDNGTDYKGEIKAYSDPISAGGKDVAVIKIDAKNLPTVQLGHSDGLSVGDEVSVIGYPGAANLNTSRESALVPTVTNGRISAVNKVMAHGTPVIQSDVNITHGNSGGPAFDAKGNVIGIATFGSQEAAGLNFFVPIDTAWEFVRQAGAEPVSGTFDSVWSEALDAYTAQHWGKAHTLLGSALELMPNQPDAIKLQRQAAANQRNAGTSGAIAEMFESPSPVLIGGGLVLVAIICIGVLVLVKSNGSSKAKPAGKGEVPVIVPGAVQLPASTTLGALHITSGPLKGKQYVIPISGLLIGRDPQKCFIVLPGENVGREHAWVMPMDNGKDVAVIDRGSANGTYVNSTSTERIKKALLHNGDKIFICRDDSTEIVYYRS
jgi:serine protease Do